MATAQQIELPRPVITTKVVAEVDALTAAFEEHIGSFQRPITHFKCLPETPGRIFFGASLYDSLSFITPISSWRALARELVRVTQEMNSSTRGGRTAKYVSWEIGRLETGESGIGIAAYLTRE